MLLRQSGWGYETAASGAVGVEFAVASGGTIILQDPSRHAQRFWYGGVGFGLSFGFRLPKIKLPKFAIRGKAVAGAGSLEQFPSGGYVFMTPAFGGQELSRSDIQGATIYVDAGVGLIAGVSGSAMLLGIDPLQLALGLSNPALMMVAQMAIARAPAVLLMAGINAGPQAGGGIGLLAGYLR